jgi:hypothetical protein
LYYSALQSCAAALPATASWLQMHAAASPAHGCELF